MAGRQTLPGPVDGGQRHSLWRRRNRLGAEQVAPVPLIGRRAVELLRGRVPGKGRAGRVAAGCPVDMPFGHARHWA